MITVAAENHSSLTPEEVEHLCRALSIQGTHHISPAWGTDHVSVQARSRRAEDWTLALLENSDQAGALGYHEDLSNGLPVMKVFVRTCEQDGVSASACASHELAEALIDPYLHRSEQDPQGRFWACEIGDPVQASTYKVNEVELQNFLCPGWFGGEPGALDYLGVVKKPLEVPPGGYAQHWNPSTGWESIGAELGAGHTRPARRRNATQKESA